MVSRNHHANPVTTQTKPETGIVFFILVFYNLLIWLDCESEAVVRSNAHGP